MRTSRHAACLLASLWLLGLQPVLAASIVDAPEDDADGAANSNDLAVALTDTNAPCRELPATLDEATRSTELDLLIERIRSSYEDSLPAEQADTAQEDKFLREVRGHLEAADVPMPSLDPDDYQRRVYKENPASQSTDAARVNSAEGTVTITERDGRSVYTYRDANGVVLYEGTPQSPGDRMQLPRAAWQIINEQERGRHLSPPDSNNDEPEPEP